MIIAPLMRTRTRMMIDGDQSCLCCGAALSQIDQSWLLSFVGCGLADGMINHHWSSLFWFSTKSRDFFYLFIFLGNNFHHSILSSLLMMPEGHGKYIACSHEKCQKLNTSHPRWPLSGEITIAPCMRTCEYCGVRFIIINHHQTLLIL